MIDDNKTTPTPAPGLDLDAVEAAHARMTAGEWHVHVLPTSPASGLLVFDVGPSDDHPVTTTSGTDTESVDEAEANAAGIVALKNAAPAMFAEVRALRAQVCRLVSGQAIESDALCQHHDADLAALAEVASLREKLAEAKRLGREACQVADGLLVGGTAGFHDAITAERGRVAAIAAALEAL